MICRECQPVFEEYLDGELGPKVAEAVGQHLATCNRCMLELNQMRAELAVFQRYSPDIEVTKTLWAGVQARLEVQESPFSNQRDSRLQGWLAGVLSAPRVSVPVTLTLVLAAVIVTVFVMNRVPQSEREKLAVQSEKNVENPNRAVGKTERAQPAAKVSERVSNAPDESKSRKASNTVRTAPLPRSSESKTPEQLVREAEKKYLAAIGMLSRDIERRQSQLDPETRTKFEQALASIDRTIGATRKAVRQHPTDPVVVQYMLAAYARKVDVLREMVQGTF